MTGSACAVRWRTQEEQVNGEGYVWKGSIHGLKASHAKQGSTWFMVSRTAVSIYLNCKDVIQVVHREI